MAVSMADLVTDIAAETAALRALLVGLPAVLDQTGDLQRFEAEDGPVTVEA